MADMNIYIVVRQLLLTDKTFCKADIAWYEAQ